MIRIVILALIILIEISGTARADTIKIGIIAPLTGVRSDAGQYMQNALILAKERIDADSSRKYKFEFAIQDSKYEPLAAVSAFKKLTDVDHISFIIGPYASTECSAVLPIARSAHVLLLTPGAQTADITEKGGNIIRLIHNTSQEAPLFAPYVAKKMNGDTLAMLMMNTVASPSYLKFFRPAFEASGKKIEQVELYEPKETDFRSFLSKFRAKRVQNVLLLAAPSQISLICAQARQMGLAAQFFSVGIEGPEMIGKGSESVEGLLYPYSYDSSTSLAEVRHFFDEYLARFNAEPDTIAANTYDGGMLLSECIEKFGPNVSKVKECLYSTRQYKGASGVFDIDGNGNAVKKLFVKTVRGGRFERCDEL